MQQRSELQAIEPEADRSGDMRPAMRPALFARYGALSRLRYDYPMVLVEADGGPPLLRPLSALIDEVLRQTAPPGAAGEALRQQVLRLEDAIRQRVAQGARDRLADLWRDCTEELLAASGEARFGPLDRSLDRAREALHVDGPVIDCDAATPKAVLIHAWHAVHRAKAREFRKRVDGLILRLADILKADHIKSDDAHTAEALESSIGDAFAADFDFRALSRVLSRSHPEDRIPEPRLQRIRRVLTILRSQRFYGPGRASERKPGQAEPHSFIFESCGAALDAFRARLPEMLEFVKALTIAELEIENKYRAERHDQVFEHFDESDLSAEQLALLPPALVCLRDGHSDNAETVRAFEALASGLPIKVLVQTDDILGDTSPEPSRRAFGGGTARLAAMAMGCNGAYVLQASAAHLHRMRDSLVAGMRHQGPALFSVFSGAVAAAPHVAPYLLAAAATESRAFPSFTYDPAAGPDWASRFALDGNPQVSADWPRYGFVFEDGAMQRQEQEIAFTLADFAVADGRYARYYRPADAADEARLVTMAEHLRPAGGGEDERLPVVLTIDAGDRLQRMVADEKIADRAARCIDAWRLLQEFAGINNSHARRLLATERAAWEKSVAAAEPLAPAARAPQAEAPAPAPAMPATPAAAEPAPAEDAAAPAETGPWIETSRCTTCNECTQINNRLFAYNENMQAYVADPDAGTYRQIVEAAESCQVSIIHPGKPRDPDEANLAELMERAEPFN